MPKFIVVGNKCRYEMETSDLMEAKKFAEKELKYGHTGNEKIVDVYQKQYTRR